MTGAVVECPLLLRCAILMREFPAYTAEALLAEPAEVFEGLWAIVAAQSRVSAALKK